MTTVIRHLTEVNSNDSRQAIAVTEPKALRTYTPTQAVLAASAGIFHWTLEGKRLYDFSSGVLVANLGHNPIAWTKRFFDYMGWPTELHQSTQSAAPPGYFSALPMTAYNGITPIEVEASRRLIEAVQGSPGGNRLEQVMWAASGSEAIQKALWAAMAHDRNRPMILATRHGFHGKKGLAGAVTGSENDPERDPRVRFIRFPMHECIDISNRDDPFDPLLFRQELDTLWNQTEGRIGCLITEPYLGGGGSFHPPKAYLQLLQSFCREHDIVFILDEVQANFGRTGSLFAFESYGLEPDMVVLGKGLGNGVPVAAVVGRSDLFATLSYGEASDTWSANPLCCASVLATLDEFAATDVLGNAHRSSHVIENGLIRLKRFPFIAHVRGEKSGMVWGLETRDALGKSANDWANAVVLACYHGNGASQDGIHLLGPLAKKVVRISPPLTITPNEAEAAMSLMDQCLARLGSEADPREKP